MARVGIVVVAAVLVVWPALHVGYFADDYLQIAKLEGHLGPHSPAGLYSFFSQDPAATAGHIARGSLPWWTVSSFRFVHLRPLASLLLELDHWVAPRDAWLHHVHSLGWLIAMVVAAAALLRRVSTGVVAGIALAVLAVDESLAWTVAWLANRCALVAATFVFAALTVHLRRAHGPTPSRALWGLEGALWALALSAGEYGVCGLAYLLAYAVLGRTDPWRHRLRAAAPAGLALAIFCVAYVASGAGVAGGDSYIDPFRETGRFVEVGVQRTARAAAEVWLSIPAETDRLWVRYHDTPLPKLVVLWNLARTTTSLQVAHGRFAFAAVAAVLAPLWALGRRWLSAEERRAVAWTAVGSLLSLVPLAATPPMTRTLLLAGLGPAVWVASMAVAATRAVRERLAATSGAWGVRRLGVGLRVGLLVAVALALLAQHTLVDVGWSRRQIARVQALAAAYRSYAVTPSTGRAELRGKHVVVLAAPDLVTTLYARWILGTAAGPVPATWHTLVMGPRRYIVRRHGADQLEISVVGEPLLITPHETLFRTPAAMLLQGDEVDAGLFVAKILRQQTWEAPRSVLFTFDRSLDDPSIVLLVSGGAGLTVLDVPAPGAAVALSTPIVAFHEVADAAR